MTARIFFLLVFLAPLAGCLEQYDPRPQHEKFKKEWENSIRPSEKIEAAAETAAPTAGTATDGGDELAAGKAKFAALCTPCHGPEGRGDGPAGAALTPKARNFADADWQGKTDDARIAEVIKNGGASVGLSPLMPPWGPSLSDAETQQIVKLIRTFK